MKCNGIVVITTTITRPPASAYGAPHDQSDRGRDEGSNPLPRRSHETNHLYNRSLQVSSTRCRRRTFFIDLLTQYRLGREGRRCPSRRTIDEGKVPLYVPATSMQEKMIAKRAAANTQAAFGAVCVGRMARWIRREHTKIAPDSMVRVLRVLAHHSDPAAPATDPMDHPALALEAQIRARLGELSPQNTLSAYPVSASALADFTYR